MPVRKDGGLPLALTNLGLSIDRTQPRLFLPFCISFILAEIFSGTRANLQTPLLSLSYPPPVQTLTLLLNLKVFLDFFIAPF